MRAEDTGRIQPFFGFNESELFAILEHAVYCRAQYSSNLCPLKVKDYCLRLEGMSESDAATIAERLVAPLRAA